MTGKIRSIKNRGFGFIRGEDGRDLFFHASGLTDALEFGTQLLERRVEFETLETDRGLQAVNIRPAGEPLQRGA